MFFKSQQILLKKKFHLILMFPLKNRDDESVSVRGKWVAGGDPGNRNTVSPFFVLEHFEKTYFSILKKEIFFLISIFLEVLPYLFQSFLIIISVCFYNKTSLKATNAVL